MSSNQVQLSISKRDKTQFIVGTSKAIVHVSHFQPNGSQLTPGHHSCMPGTLFLILSSSKENLWDALLKDPAMMLDVVTPNNYGIFADMYLKDKQ